MAIDDGRWQLSSTNKVNDGNRWWLTMANGGGWGERQWRTVVDSVAVSAGRQWESAVADGRLQWSATDGRGRWWATTAANGGG